MGPDGDSTYAAFPPAIAYNSFSNEYLVVWSGDDQTDGEFEIFGQRIAADGTEIGADFRVSDMGPDGSTFYDAYAPDVAHNGMSNQYLVVWEGDDDVLSSNDEFEIFGQCIDGSTGSEIGDNDFLVSGSGGSSLFFDDLTPAVAWNSGWGRFLVTWSGTWAGGPGSQYFQVEGQAFEPPHPLTSCAVALGTEFDISDASLGHDAFSPDVVYNQDADEYLVVWQGENTSLLPNDGFEVFGQRLHGGIGGDPAMGQVGANDFRISSMGPDGNRSFEAISPAVAYNGITGEYLVVWDGDDDTGRLTNNEIEVFAQRLIGLTGKEVGVDDFRVSRMGPDGDATFSARSPAIVAGERNRYLVVWDGDDDSGALVEGEFEIFGQFLDVLFLRLFLGEVP
jgi:hypothetical protein